MLRENPIKNFATPMKKGVCGQKKCIDLYSFGMPMPGRNYTSSSYRFGFNGQEKDDEISGSGNHIDFKFRGYDPRTGRFWTIDPMVKEFPFYSPYQFASNNPILAADLEGLESSNIKNKTETKTSEKTKSADPKAKATDPNTVGKNTFGSVYMGTKGNPKHYDGTDSYEPKPQDEPDNAARTHDMESGGIGYRSFDNIVGDVKFIASATKTVAKKIENEVVIPFIGANPNKDAITGKPITGQSTGRAVAGATAITLLTAAKVILAVTVDPAVKVYDASVDFANDVKYKTEQGINAIQNWGH
jgi:RHS repeat-associated protein